MTKPALSVVPGGDEAKSGRNPDSVPPASQPMLPADVTAAIRPLDDDDKVSALLPILAELPKGCLGELVLALADMVSCETKSDIALALYAGLPYPQQHDFVTQVQYGMPPLRVAWDQASIADQRDLLDRVTPPQMQPPKRASKFHPSTFETSNHDVAQAYEDYGALLARHLALIDRQGCVTDAQQIEFEHRASLVMWQVNRGFRDHVAIPQMISANQMRRLRYQNATANELTLWHKVRPLLEVLSGEDE